MQHIVISIVYAQFFTYFDGSLGCANEGFLVLVVGIFDVGAEIGVEHVGVRDESTEFEVFFGHGHLSGGDLQVRQLVVLEGAEIRQVF